MEQYKGTTIVCVRRNKQVVLGGDGQITNPGAGTILKSNGKKVRRLFNNQVIAGFAGGLSDCLTLFELFESKLESYSGNLVKAAVALAKDWRTDKMLRRLEALLVVADKKTSLTITGNGDVIEPEDDNLIAVGSGGSFAQSAAMALLEHTDLSAQEIVKKSLEIAASICIYTNNYHTIETLESET